jgi:phage tail-like protein
MEGKRKQPSTSYRFKLVLGGHETAGFFEQATANVEGGTVDLAQTQKITGLNEAGDIALKRGVDNNKVLWKWRQIVIDGDVDAARKNGSIVLLDYEGTPVTSYTIINAWPSKYNAPKREARRNEAALEEIVITHEGLERA